MSELKKITLYKIKKDLDFKDFLKTDLNSYEEIDPVEFEDDASNTYEYSGLVKFTEGRSKKKTTKNFPWMVFLNSAFEDEVFKFESRNKFPRAVLALRIVDKSGEKDPICYLAAFGIGAKSLFCQDAVVHDFGIKVGMNICDHDKLRRIQTTYHESTTQQTEKQASSGTSLNAFNLDNDNELLRRLSGVIKDDYSSVVETFTGKDAINLKSRRGEFFSWDDLVKICLLFDERYMSDDYRSTEFARYDDFRHETDKGIIEDLDEKLLNMIKNHDYEKLHLSPPEFVNYDEIYFSYRKGGETYEELKINDLVTSKSVTSSTVLRTVKGWRIHRYRVEGDVYAGYWRAYDCYVAEVDLETKTYILSNGHWFQISQDIKDRIDLFISEIEPNYSYEVLPDNVPIYVEKTSGKGENREEVFNDCAVNSSENLFSFDKAKLRIAGENKYEICDIFSNNKCLIHVKKYSSGASSISHLFVQAKFYADAFSSDESTRDSMREYIESTCSLVDSINSGKDAASFTGLIPQKSNEVLENEYCVVFCVLHSKELFGIENLPLMAQYELMKTYKYLSETRKFKVDVVFKKVLIGPQD
ncbi:MULTISPECIES: DUF6119 family protein [unclassified Maridesulfovibrio]|uniref:DUF6119 family protein n=1 Tax=unclassified Maridesulfovibrio TaxID=2794999 RepID=UPI003B3FBBA4